MTDPRPGAARGTVIHRRQEELVRRKGVIVWTQREFEEIRAAVQGAGAVGFTASAAAGERESGGHG